MLLIINCFHDQPIVRKNLPVIISMQISRKFSNYYPEFDNSHSDVIPAKVEPLDNYHNMWCESLSLPNAGLYIRWCTVQCTVLYRPPRPTLTTSVDHWRPDG